MLELHDWIFIKFMWSWQVISTILSTSVVMNTTSSSFVIISNNKAAYWMISWTLWELHLQLSLHIIIFLLSLLFAIIFDTFNSSNIVSSINKFIDFCPHLSSLIFSAWLSFLMSVDEVLEIHVFITWKFFVGTFSLRPIMWKCLPIKVLWPFCKIKSKFESHVCWKSNKVIHIIWCKDASNVCVSTNVYWSYLVASINEITWR